MEAENYVYESYLKAENPDNHIKRDEEKRNPQFTREIIRKMAGTPNVVITGSKGKGSVASMISQILQSEMNVGVMTSPHLLSFNERFKINGVDISDHDFIEQIEKIKHHFEKIEVNLSQNEYVSPMGIQTALALNYFNEKKTDFNIFEMGKGAKYDDVNNIDHDFAIINTIFLEHTRELGSTLKEIAENKAAIITGEQKCVYVADQQVEVLEVIKKRAQEFSVDFKVYGKDFYTQNVEFTSSGMIFDVVVGALTIEKVQVPLLGEHQAKNCALAMAMSLDVLKENKFDLIKENLAKLKWPGRLEIISSNPFILLDACINNASCQDIKNVLKELNLDKVTLIMGIPDDKDYRGVAESMAMVSHRIILTKSSNPHYIFTNSQSEHLKKLDMSILVSEDAKNAIEIARGFKDPIVILGTTSLISDVKNMYKK